MDDAIDGSILMNYLANLDLQWVIVPLDGDFSFQARLAIAPQGSFTLDTAVDLIRVLTP